MERVKRYAGIPVMHQKQVMAALDHISEFRFVYWTDRRSRHYTVKRDWDHRSDLWGVFDGDGAWTGEKWENIGGLPHAFCWPLDEALKLGEKLAFEENQRIVAIMERDHPGEYRGTSHDLMATHTGAPERMTVNPEPLKVVEGKAGEKTPEPEYLLARRWRGEYLKAASIHRDGCRAAPEDGKELRDGTRWAVEKIPQSKVNDAVNWAADKGVEARVWCGTCKGWSVT